MIPYEPSEKEIEKQCTEIRAGWSKREELNRLGLSADHVKWEVPMISVKEVSDSYDAILRDMNNYDKIEGL